MDEWLRPIVVVAIPTIGAVIWISRWFGKHDEWMKGMAEFKEDTRKSLAEIRDDIKKILAGQPRNVLAGASPLQLTDLGREVSEYVGAAAWAEQKALELVDKMKDESAYGVQEFCINFMRAEYKLTTKQDQSFKKCAYEHGIKLEQVLDVCAVELRDRLLHISNISSSENKI